MLKLSRLADYAVVIMGQLARDERAEPSAADIAEATRLPMETARKLLKQLGRAQLVVAKRGAHGGYRLARSARDVTVLDIITAIEGPVALTACADANHGLPCAHEAHCPLVRGWAPVNEAIRSALSSVSLADMIPATTRAAHQPRANRAPASIPSPAASAPHQVACSPSPNVASSNHG